MDRSLMQRWLVTLLPKSWAESMEKESKEWKVICPCGAKDTIWDIGGIRWKARAHKKTSYVVCRTCGEGAWMIVKREFQDE